MSAIDDEFYGKLKQLANEVKELPKLITEGA